MDDVIQRRAMTQPAPPVVEGRWGTPPASPACRPARARSVFARFVETRRGRRHLARMEPRSLADIGASRADAWAEARRPWWDFGPPPPDAARQRRAASGAVPLPPSGRPGREKRP